MADFVAPDTTIFGFFTEEGVVDLLRMFSGGEPPSYLYAALCHTAPTPYQHSTDLDEVSDEGYERVTLINGTNWVAYQGQLFNDTEIAWAVGTGDVRGWALLDAPVDGRVLYGGDWGTVTTITGGYTAPRAACAVPMAITDWALEG